MRSNIQLAPDSEIDFEPANDTAVGINSKRFLRLTAAELMSREILTIHIHSSLVDAARRLAQNCRHGAPVVDDDGRCVGVLSVSDLARSIITQHTPGPTLHRTCHYQQTLREPGSETILCVLDQGACPFQSRYRTQDGRELIACGEPHSVPVDWQIVEKSPLPKDIVSHYMTLSPATATLDTGVTTLAKIMANNKIQRVVVVDGNHRPVGIVSSSDIIAALAAAETLKCSCKGSGAHTD